MKHEIDMNIFGAEGPGDKDCSKCHGAGVIPVPKEEGDKGPPSYTRCSCTLQKDILANADRIYKGLSAADPVEKSALTPYINQNLWVTADTSDFLKHLRHIAIRKPPTWHCKVTSDVDLMSAWLASATVKGIEILDVDVATNSKKSLEALTLVDLVAPPELLIVRVGVKVARNKAAPEVLLEALSYREHERLPTWVWDRPSYTLEAGHISYSPAVGEEIAGWKRLVMGPLKPRVSRTALPSLDEVLNDGVDPKLSSVGKGSKSDSYKKPKNTFRKSWRSDDEDDEGAEESEVDKLLNSRRKP